MSVAQQASRYWRFRIFFFMWFSYVLYYFSRKSFTYAKPLLGMEMGLDKGDLGLIVSAMTFCYALSKFTGGILADKLSPRILVGLGLILGGLANIFFGLASSLAVFLIIWCLNGWFQGLGAVPCAKLMVHWYPQEERGRWWSFWNTSHNVGAISVAVLVGYIATYYNWQLAFHCPGLLCIAGGLVAMIGLRDRPENVGLPPVDEDHPANAGADDEKLTVRELLFEHVFPNRVLMILAVAYFLVYVVRWGFVEWTAFYLNETTGCSHLMALGMFVPFELGGFFGNISAGFLSDKVFDGRRGPVNFLFTVGAGIAAYGLWVTPAASPMLAISFIFLAGFFIFGPQMMVGMAAAESADKKAAATSNGFVNLFAYLGASFAGYPLGKICDVYGWDGYFIAILAVAALAAILLAPLWSLQSRAKQLELMEEEKDLKYA